MRKDVTKLIDALHEYANARKIPNSISFGTVHFSCLHGRFSEHSEGSLIDSWEGQETWGPPSLFQWIPEREDDHSRPSSARTESEWSHVSTSLHAFMV